MVENITGRRPCRASCADCETREAVTLREDGVFRCDGCAKGVKGAPGLEHGLTTEQLNAISDRAAEKALAGITGLDSVRIGETMREIVALKDGASELLSELSPQVEAVRAFSGKAADIMRDARGAERDLKKETERIRKLRTIVEINVHDGEKQTKVEGVTHALLPRLIELIADRTDLYIHGPAGGGKNTAAEQAAKALELPYYALQLSQLSLRSELTGFISPVSLTPSETPFSLAYTNGGVFAADELDNWNAGIVTSINSALANGRYSFPWGSVPRHRDFVFLGMGNTIGLGGAAHHVSRRALDGATRDRMVHLFWPVDEHLETLLGCDADWTQLIQRARREALENGNNVLITPRATIQGGQLLRRGWSRRDVVDAVLLRGVECPSYLRQMITDYVGAGVK